jgi:hypothetical protein
VLGRVWPKRPDLHGLVSHLIDAAGYRSEPGGRGADDGRGTCIREPDRRLFTSREGKNQMIEDTPSPSESPGISTISPQTWLWWMRRQSRRRVASEIGTDGPGPEGTDAASAGSTH